MLVLRDRTGSQFLQEDATAVAVGAYVDKKYTASSPPVNKVVVIGKWTVAGCAGWLMLSVVGCSRIGSDGA